MSNLKRDIDDLIFELLKTYCEFLPEDTTLNELRNEWRGFDTDGIDKANQSIINLIESVLPEEKEEYDQCDRGFNQAIKDIKSKLIGKE